MRRNRKHQFVLPVLCDLSENATDTILRMALENSQGNINIDSDANLCSNNTFLLRIILLFVWLIPLPLLTLVLIMLMLLLQLLHMLVMEVKAI